MTDKPKPLSRKHLAFIDQYFLANFNATEAYMRVYKPKSGRATARANAADLLAIPNIKAAIDTRLAEVHMSADEALMLTAEIARGDIGDFMAIGSMGFSLDLESAREQGKTKLIRKVKQRTTTFIAKKQSEEDREITEIEIELYPADSALERIMRAHGIFKDNIKIEGGVEIITKRIGVDLGKV